MFKLKSIVLLGSGSVAAVVLANALVRLICKNIIRFDCPTYWPISVFSFRLPSGNELWLALAVLLGFLCALAWLARNQYRLKWVIWFGILLVLATNLVQGLENGLVIPIAGTVPKPVQYYHDAVKIADPALFLNHFEQIQPGLQVHGRTHPPGAVLLFYLLSKLSPRPALISLAIAILSVILTLYFFHKMLALEFGKSELPGYVTLLLVIAPAVQVYYLASLDAVIAGLFIGGLYFFRHPKPVLGTIGSILFLFPASFLTFGFVFLIPVMVGFEVLRRKSLRRSAAVLAGLAIIYYLVFRVFNFNYLQSFLTASALENPFGFWLFANPATYLFTRLEGIAEILLFLGPFLGWLMIRGIRTMKNSHPDLSTLTRLGAITLLAMLLAGAFRTGECARAGLFIYPYLLFPVAGYLHDHQVSPPEKTILPVLVFTQSLLMQTFGFYFW